MENKNKVPEFEGMQLDTIKYQDLIDLGFSRQDIEDDVCFLQNGYYGFNIELEFPSLNIGISSPCIAQNDGKQWDFQLNRVDTGNVIRKISLVEVLPLVEFFKAKSYTIEEELREVDMKIILDYWDNQDEVQAKERGKLDE